MSDVLRFGRARRNPEREPRIDPLRIALQHRVVELARGLLARIQAVIGANEAARENARLALRIAHRNGRYYLKIEMQTISLKLPDDLLSALERAVRYGAFSLQAVQRILAARGRRKAPLDSLADDHRSYIDRLLDGTPTPPRPTSDYQALLGERRHDAEPTDTGSSNKSPAEEPDDPDDGGIGPPW